jgi:hypothetical protein
MILFFRKGTTAAAFKNSLAINQKKEAGPDEIQISAPPKSTSHQSA